MLMVKNSLCIFFILSAYTENRRKGFKRLRRLRRKYLSICGKYLSVDGKYGKLGLFAVQKIVSVCAESI
jgi:hypothetical protein